MKNRLQVIQLLFTFYFLLFTFFCFSQGVGFNATGAAADNSAMLDVSATGKGLLLPRMTTAQRPSVPTESLIIYNTDTQCFEAYNAATSQWVNVACIGTPFTCGSGTITDIEGNVYNTVKIGTQCWMKENLKTTKYGDNTAIPYVTDNTAWLNLTTGAYANYNHDANNVATYGRLYNGYTVNDSRKICPAGWHVPTDDEWTTLTTLYGGESVAGGNLKEAGLAHWGSPNTGADNSSGFTALPGGARNITGTFYSMGSYGLWWTSTDSWDRYLCNFNTTVYRVPANKQYGFSVRCIKDN